jgi:hypothetical protein
MIVIDPRKGGQHIDQIPDTAYVPLSAAHLLIGKARVTVYRWVNEDRLGTRDIGSIGKAMKQYVRAGDVRELAARQWRRTRHAPKPLHPTDETMR